MTPHICLSGILKDESAQTNPESARNDVAQDVFLMFMVVDENLSWYLEDNIENCTDSSGVDQEDPDFVESNLMHGDKFISSGLTQIKTVKRKRSYCSRFFQSSAN